MRANKVDFIKLEEAQTAGQGVPFKWTGKKYEIACPCGMEMISRGPRHLCDRVYGGCGSMAIICQKNVAKDAKGNSTCSGTFRAPAATGRLYGDACPNCIAELSRIREEKIAKGEIVFDPERAQELRIRGSLDTEKQIAALQAQVEALLKASKK